MAEYVVIDKEQLEADITTVSDSIRGLIETEEKLEFPQGMKEAVESYSLDEPLEAQDALIEQIKTALQGKASSGMNVPHLLDITEYIHAEDWLVASVGNVMNFANTYCNHEDLTDYSLYICYIENNTASQKDGNYLLKQRYSENAQSSVNIRENWTNIGAGVMSSRDFFISKGAKITVIRFGLQEG